MVFTKEALNYIKENRIVAITVDVETKDGGCGCFNDIKVFMEPKIYENMNGSKHGYQYMKFSGIHIFVEKGLSDSLKEDSIIDIEGNIKKNLVIKNCSFKKTCDCH